jgi:type IV pilus assembly protein PilV
MKIPPSRRQGGIALLEAMIAIVILGIGLLGTVGLQARAYSALSDAGMRGEATLAAESLLGVMAVDVGNLPKYAKPEDDEPDAALAPWVAETQAHIPGALITVAVTDLGTSVYKVDILIRWQRKANADFNRYQVTSYIAS